MAIKGEVETIYVNNLQELISNNMVGKLHMELPHFRNLKEDKTMSDTRWLGFHPFDLMAC